MEILQEESELELFSRCSPAIPLVVPIPIRPRPSGAGSGFKHLYDNSKENKENAAPSNVRITLTLNSEAARDVMK